MSRTLDLLRLTPETALREMITESLVPGVSSSAFKLGEPVEVSGKDTSIILELDKLNVPVDLWIYSGVVDFRYPRLDLGVEFAKFEPEVVVDFPTTTKTICDAITKRYGILFDEKDFVEQYLEYVERNGFVLTSKPESLRWVGNYPMQIKQRVLELNESFLNKYLELYNEPVTGPFAVLFVAAINAGNLEYLYREVLQSELVFSDPEPANVLDHERNTQIVVSVGTSDLYKGETTFYYNRLNLSALTHDEPPLVRSIRYSEYWEAAIDAGEQLGVTITQADVVPGVLPAPAQGVVVDLTIEIVEHSKAFTGPLHIRFQRAV